MSFYVFKINMSNYPKLFKIVVALGMVLVVYLVLVARFLKGTEGRGVRGWMDMVSESVGV